MASLSRRDFLRAGGLAVLGTAAAACSKGGSKTNGARTLDQIIRGRQQTVSLIANDSETLSNKPERLAFALVDPANGVVVADATANVWVARGLHTPALGPFRTTWHDDGLGAKGIYETAITYPADGTWDVLVELRRLGQTRSEVAISALQVGVQTAMPKFGEPAIVVPTPTVANARGVHPICTRKPPCSMHAISLDRALASKKPVVLIFATPQFCTSALCGPEVDIVQSVSHEFGSEAQFIHVELYKDDKPATVQRQITSPAATQWKITQEPVIYYINGAGLIVNRSIGPVDRGDVRAATRALITGTSS